MAANRNDLRERWDDNEECPRYIAYAAEDSYVDADDVLDKLLDILKDHCRLFHEDCVVWERGLAVVAVVKADGEVTRFAGLPAGRKRLHDLKRGKKKNEAHGPWPLPAKRTPSSNGG